MADEVTCVVCNRKRSKTEAEVFQLTAEEKAALAKRDQAPPSEIAYCRPCFRLMKSPETAANLLKGTMLMRLRAAGVANADQIAEEFRKKLLAKTTKGPK